MNDPYTVDDTPEPIPHSVKDALLLRTLPYAIVLGLVLFGVAYTSIAEQPMGFFWELVAIATGVLCVTTGWAKLDSRATRVRLMWTQAVHWIAIFFAMSILFLPSVQRLLPSQATGLALLLLLALGTFLAGIHVSWEICILGLVMAMLVPAIAWLKGSALFLVLAIAGGVALGTMLWRQRSDRSA
jgi:hypothetical protein